MTKIDLDVLVVVKLSRVLISGLLHTRSDHFDYCHTVSDKATTWPMRARSRVKNSLITERFFHGVYLTLLNVQYVLSYSNGPGTGTSVQKGRGVLVVAFRGEPSGFVPS